MDQSIGSKNEVVSVSLYACRRGWSCTCRCWLYYELSVLAAFFGASAGCLDGSFSGEHGVAADWCIIRTLWQTVTSSFLYGW